MGCALQLPTVVLLLLLLGLSDQQQQELTSFPCILNRNSNLITTLWERWKDVKLYDAKITSAYYNFESPNRIAEVISAQCAIHENQTCLEYQDSLTGHSKLTERYIEDLKSLGEVMNCPKCQTLINKIAGCSWLVCSSCKIEICWATKGPRWGPLGKGDTNGGCRCRIGGKSCHPLCENCH